MSIRNIGEKLFVALLLLGFFVLRCNYLDTVPRWDAASYWGGVMQAVNATKGMASWAELPKIILENYNVYGHPAMGYVSLLVLGQLIDFPNQFALNITHILLALACVFSVYKILRWFLPEKNRFIEVVLATIAFAMEPLFFGCSIYLNTDFPVLVFFTIALACLLYGHYGFFAIASIFMIFSKEPGIIFWAGLCGGLFFYSLHALIYKLRAGQALFIGDFFPHRHKGQLFTFGRSFYSVVCLLVPGLSFKLYTMARAGAMWTGDTGLKFDSNGWNCFGFNSRVMLNRGGEMFLLNFHWVVTLIIIAAGFIALGRALEKRRAGIARSISANAWGIFPILFCFLAFVVFNLSYITYIIPRYVVNVGFFLVIFTVLLLQLAVHSRALRIACLALMVGLFSVQTFRTVDPLSKLAFGKTRFGAHEILQIDNPGEAVGNGFVYNSEFTMVDKLFNMMQKAMPIKPDTQIIAWNADVWYPWFYMGGVFVDPKTLERTVDWRGTFYYNVIDIAALQTNPSPSLPDKAFYVYMPWLSQFSNEPTELGYLQNFYRVSEPHQIEHNGYRLRYYELNRLP